jgi:predicted metal-binding protein
METDIRVGIIICDRYRLCAGGKCFRALSRREGAFDRYKGMNVELAGYTTCGGCPGGNVEGSLAEMKKNGVQIVHLATGLVVGYPPCPWIAEFVSFIREAGGLEVVVGTHPIPQKYYLNHEKFGTWQDREWGEFTGPTMTDVAMRLLYD